MKINCFKKLLQRNEDIKRMKMSISSNDKKIDRSDKI